MSAPASDTASAFRLDGRRALVAGATSGIGAAVDEGPAAQPAQTW